RMPILSDGELQLHVAPVRGKLLSDCFREQRPSLEQATQIVVQIAAALAALHAQGLVHGRIFPDRVYLQGELATLVSDPIANLTATLDRSAVGLLGARLGLLQPEQFLAPEFIAPGQLPTRASDVYSLGCMWHWLLIGRPPAAGETPQQI